MPTTTQAKTSKKKRAPAESEALEVPESPESKTPKPPKTAQRSKESKPDAAQKRSASAEKESAPESKSKKPAAKAKSSARAPIDLGGAVLQALATNERMNQYLLENLDDRAWTAAPPAGQGRTIAAIVSHMHNVRHMWLTVAAKGRSAPDKLDRKSVTKSQALKALAASQRALSALFEHSLEQGGRVKEFKPDVVGFLGYVIAHESHHRGQICMLARELGLPLSHDAGYGMWDWNKRWKESGSAE